MSILHTRLLERAELAYGDGNVHEAETLCYQVVLGAVAVKNVSLTIKALQLFGQHSDIGTVDRYNAMVAAFNFITTLQRDSNPDEGLALCDTMIETLGHSEPGLRRKTLEVAVFIATHGRRDRKKYLDALIGQLGPGASGKDRRAEPEVSVAEGPATAAEVLSARGCVLVRGVLDPVVLDAVRKDADVGFITESRQAVPLTELDNYQRIVCGPAESYLSAVLTPFLTEKPALQPELCYVRQVAAEMPETTVPFHQDLNAFGRVLVNVWAPLTACGVTAPGLELVAERVYDLADTVPAKSQYNDLQISQELITERYGEDVIFRPQMDPGDVLILLGTTIHRTYLTPAMDERRTSLELRFG